MPAMYVVILAGGGGTRLRPLSRDDRPKPFLPLLDDRTLLQHTVDRVKRHVANDIHVVTDARYADLVRAQVPGVNVIAEPVGRNTAAAIALATLAIDKPDGEVMVVLPSDHLITHVDIFQRVLASAGRHLAADSFGVSDPLVTLGIQIDRPATEYGYLIPDIDRGEVVNGLQAYPLTAFEEKPTAERAEELYTLGGGRAWNAGMFLWRRRAIRSALAASTPLLSGLAPAVRTGDPAILARAYERLTPISIDYAVLQPAASDGRVVMAAMEVGWSDIGGWGALLAALGSETHPTTPARIVHPPDEATLAEDDLAVAAASDSVRLVIHAGPGTIRSDGPIALLTGAAADRERIAQLLDRCARMEAQQP
jgi:mannose-1-phosphate guanylyltransferase